MQCPDGKMEGSSNASGSLAETNRVLYSIVDAKAAQVKIKLAAFVSQCPKTVLFLFPRTFFLQGFGFGLLYWAISTQRNDCCTRQSAGNEMTVLLVSLQATGGGWPNPSMWAKNSLRGGRKPSMLLWEDVSSHNKLAARAVKVPRTRSAEHLAMRATVTAWRNGQAGWTRLDWLREMACCRPSEK